MTTAGDGVQGFGALLQRHRRAAGLSQQELAERAGLSLRGIADLERGVRRSPYPATVRRLVEALGLDEAARTALVAVAQPGTPASGPAQIEPTRSLPVPLSSFVGREREVADVKGLLETARLLTLVGLGGVGKTRLALVVAAEVGQDCSEGIAFVELAALTEPTLLAQATASALGLREQPGRPLIETLINAIGSHRMLLVLDNCEHLIEAAAHLAAALLGACPALRILATSRESLRVDGEIAWRVPSLSLPAAEGALPVEALACHDAAQLFLERARAAMPGLEVTARDAGAIAQVCRRLDGIPLAIELAAARIRVLSLEQIAERLDDQLGLLVSGTRTAPSRQQTLRATMDWSYALLSESERALHRRLAVFAGGWTLEAAQAVAARDDVDAGAVLDLLEHLVDKSLVVAALHEPGDGGHRARHQRYRLLEPIRQYAAERLAAEDDLERRRQCHYDWFVRQAERVAPGVLEAAHLAWLEEEHDNLRAALRWTLERGAAEAGLRLANAVYTLWFLRGYAAEGRRWLLDLLALPGAPDTGTRVMALNWAGHLTYCLGEYTAAEVLISNAHASAERLQDAPGLAMSYQLLGNLARYRGQHARARDLFREAAYRHHALGSWFWEAINRTQLADVLYESGEYEAAAALATENLALSRARGPSAALSRSLETLALLATARDDLATARALLEEGLAIEHAHANRFGMMRSQLALGQALGAQENISEALQLLGESLRGAEYAGDRVVIARILEIIGRLVARSQPAPAVRLAAAAAALRASVGAPPNSPERAHLDDWLAAARQRLGAHEYASQWAVGCAPSAADAVQEALHLTQARVSDDHAQTG